MNCLCALCFLLPGSAGVHGQDFQSEYARLKAGRSYSFGRIGDLSQPPLLFAPAATISKARRNSHGLWHPYLFVVPHSYDPARRYPVRFYLQGDTTQPASSAESGARWLNYETLAREDAIVVFPGAWNGFPWWGASQVEHMNAVLDELKRSYNVDENRVYLLGSSDGGVGIYYHAMVNTTPWAAFLPFNADPGVLAYRELAVDAQLHAGNLANKPLFVVHGGRDQIFPAASVRAWLRLFTSAGADVTFRLKERYGHETRWWAEEAPVMDAFMMGHRRDPLPDRVSWETADTARINRAHWVVVNELGAAASETAFETMNAVMPAAAGVGIGRWTEVPGSGVRIAMIQPGSPADVHGLREDDVIVGMRDIEQPDFAQVEGALQAAAGTSVPVRLLRVGQQLSVSLAVPSAPAPAPIEALPHPRPSGRIDVERRGNLVDVRTRGVRRFTLLLSPEEFEFARPIRVVANGATVFDAIMTPSVEVLRKWAARDNDRTMLFAQELEISLP